uniref:Pre-mRNA-splicing helicase BRR2-like plug domain-containing protein n=1 Tax=Caenorhabditis japonica TaxID=281687 RepID=A0A8R1HT44_CAEJA
MADELARIQQYEYRQNSNLVLSVDYNLTDRRGREEPTGEVLPITDKEMRRMKMGDRAIKSKAPVQEQKKKRKRKDDDRTLRQFGKSVLGDNTELMGAYKPRTQETKQTYEVILAFIHEAIGDVPREVLCGAADEVLITLKNDKIREKEKKKEVETLLGSLTDERTAVLINLAKKITDFSIEEENKVEGDEIDENEGVNVQFDSDEEEEDGGMVNEIKGDSDQSEDEDGVDTDYTATLKGDGHLT